MPEPTAITFDAVQEATLQPHRVYVREHWGDQWTLVEDLQATQIEWTLSPTIPTAQIGPRLYGRAIPPGNLTWEKIDSLASRARWFVKIECDVEDLGNGTDPLLWYGILETAGDNRGGLRTIDDEEFRHGEQTWTAYGLESLLAREVIHQAWYRDPDDNDDAVEIAPPFNEDRTKNRAAVESGSSYKFSSLPRGQEEQFWSSKQIVRYLLEMAAPQGLGDVPIAWVLAGDDLIPDDDVPIVDQYGRSVLDVLNEVLAPSRLLGYWLTLSDDETQVELHPCTFVGEPTLLGSITIPAAASQITISLEEARDVSAVTIRETSAGVVDQVIYRGARRRSCCTLSYRDHNLELGWDAGDETKYEQAASTDADYPDETEVAERRKRNADSRQTLGVHAVYRRYQVPADWDQQAADGQGGELVYPVFPNEEGNPYQQNRRWLRLLPVLPLRDGIDYTDVAEHGEVKAGLGPWDEQPPMVFAPYPSQTGDLAAMRYVQLDRLTAAAAVEETDPKDQRDWSIRVEIPRNDTGLMLHVDSAPQYAIAFFDFTPLAEDEPHGQWTWHDVAITVAWEDQRWCEGRWPADDDLPALSEVRRKIIYAGDDYKQDRLCPGTIIGISAVTGKPVHAVGGWIRNDSEKLQEKAKAAYAYLSVERRSLSFQTHRVNNLIKLGDYVRTIDGDEREIKSVVTSIALSIVHGAEVDAATLAYGTGFVERDQLRF
jgi:hypothetical protein